MIENSLDITTDSNVLLDVNKKKLHSYDLRSKLTSPYLQLISDVIAFSLSYFTHYFIRFHSGLFINNIQPDTISVISPLPFLVIYWIILFWLSGLYKDWYVRSPFDELFNVIRISFIGTFIIFFFVFLDSKSPRLLFLIYLAIFCIFSTIGRLLARNLQKNLRAKRIIVIPVILIGTAKEIKDLHDKTISAKSWGYQPIGVVLNNEKELEKWDNFEFKTTDKSPVLGLVNDLSQILRGMNPKEVLIAVDNQYHPMLLNITSVCVEHKIPIKIVPDLYDFFTGQAKIMHLYGIPLIEISTQLLKPWQYIIKRFIDIMFSAMFILIGLPIWSMIALIIKLESKGPIFYKQVRVGKDGRTFMIFKFRSMVLDAEKHGPKWASVNDKRVTQFGRFIRKSHLDEIPQFWNVLKGEMSLVGPRPERPVFVDKFTLLVPYYKRRLVVRPGITGWWQIKYTTYEESIEEIENRLKNDFFYIENMSLKLDFEIIVRTIFLMLRGHGQA